MQTYDTGNQEVVKLLRLRGEAMDLYAAQRIEELEREVEALRNTLGRIHSLVEVDHGRIAELIREECKKAGGVR